MSGYAGYLPWGPTGQNVPSGLDGEGAKRFVDDVARKDTLNPEAKGGLAMVFLKADAAMGFGHVAFAFLAKRYYGWRWVDSRQGSQRNGVYFEDLWLVGSLDNPWGTPYTPHPDAGYNWKRTGDPVAYFREQGYDAFKFITAAPANPVAAGRASNEWQGRDYRFITQNCEDACYDVLGHYGAALPAPISAWAPSTWFERIPGTALPLSSQGSLKPLPHRIEWVGRFEWQP